MKLPLGGEAGRQAIGGEREEIKKLPTTPPSALTATSLPSQHIISGRKEKKHGRCSNNSPIRSLVSHSCLSNAALLCCNKETKSPDFQKLPISSFSYSLHYSCPAGKESRQQFLHTQVFDKAKALLKQKRITALRRTGVQGETLMKG